MIHAPLEKSHYFLWLGRFYPIGKSEEGNARYFAPDELIRYCQELLMAVDVAPGGTHTETIRSPHIPELDHECCE